MISVFDIPVDVHNFSDGSLQVSLSPEIETAIDLVVDENPLDPVKVRAHVKSNDDLIALVQAIACIRQMYSNTLIYLYLPYIPYGRGDRVMGNYQCGGLKSIAPIINSLKAQIIYTYDPHSSVSEALLDDLYIVEQHECLADVAEQYPQLLEVDYIISPDLGASKKVLKASEFFKLPMIEAGKVRELGTNKILSSTLYLNEEIDLTGATVLIVDDICEYGTTHRELAKMLKEKYGVAKVKLFVTHGIFPLNKRLEVPSRYDFVLEHIDEIYCNFLWKNEHNEASSQIKPLVIF